MIKRVEKIKQNSPNATPTIFHIGLVHTLTILIGYRFASAPITR